MMKPTLSSVLKIFFVYILSTLLAATLIVSALFFVHPESSSENRGLIQLIVILIVTIPISFFLYKQGVKNLRSLFFEKSPSSAFTKEIKGPIKTGLLYSLIALPLMIMGTLICNLLGMKMPEQEIAKLLPLLLDTPVLFAALSFCIVIIMPFIEEILFRGYLQTYLRNKWNKTWAIFFTSLIFTLFHYEDQMGSGNFILLSLLFILSLFFGYIKEKTGSLWSSIAMHSSINALGSLAIILGLE